MKRKKEAQEYYGFNRWETLIIVGLLLCSILSPFIFTQFDSGVSFIETGPIGDTFGGLTEPFINLLAAFLVYKSFTAQIRANIDQRKAHREEMKAINKEQSIKYFGQIINIMIEDFIENEKLSRQKKGWVFELNQAISHVKKNLQAHLGLLRASEYKNEKELEEILTIWEKISSAITTVNTISETIDKFDENGNSIEETILSIYHYKRLVGLMDEYGYDSSTIEQFSDLNDFLATSAQLINDFSSLFNWADKIYTSAKRKSIKRIDH